MPAPRRKVDEPELRRLHAEGLDGVRMAAALGVSPPAVQQCCRRLGLPLPGPRNGCGRGRVRPGDRFGRLVADRDTGLREHRQPVWQCRCDCGRPWRGRSGLLLRRQDPVRSCGCLRQEVAAEHCRRVGLEVQAERRKRREARP